MYTKGLIDNIKLAPIIYPGWTPRVYLSRDDKLRSISQLHSLRAEVVLVDADPGQPWAGLFWRFLPAADPSIDRFISRDTDSRLNVREKAAVDEWTDSKKPFHVMRDHKNHDVPILGGMWGCVGGFLPDLNDSISSWIDKSSKGCDQKFLAAIVWPKVRDQHIGHDEFFPNRYGGPPARRFPKHPRFDGKHVGEVIK
jgi:hypothetical protein